jgi:hypothetical protein
VEPPPNSVEFPEQAKWAKSDSQSVNRRIYSGRTRLGIGL